MLTLVQAPVCYIGGGRLCSPWSRHLSAISAADTSGDSSAVCAAAVSGTFGDIRGAAGVASGLTSYSTRFSS